MEGPLALLSQDQVLERLFDGVVVYIPVQVTSSRILLERRDEVSELDLSPSSSGRS